MELTIPQSKILSDLTRFRVLVCGRKFGKTTLASEEIIACGISKNDRRVMYIAPTLDDARRLMWDRVKNQFVSSSAKTNDTRLELIVPTIDKGKSHIFLGSWEKVDNYRGDEFDLIVFDEVQEYRNFWVGWQESMRPTLTPRLGTALFMGTPKGFSHFYDLYNSEAKDGDFKSFHFTSYDNPHIPIEEIEAAKRTLTEDRFAQEYLADFRKTEGLVYKEFSRDKHLFDDETLKVNPIDIYERIAGLDFGYTNPAALPFIGVATNKHYWVQDEYYHSGRTEDEIADFVASQNFQRVYPDPESASGIAMLRKKGVNVRDVNKGKDSIVHGIQKIRELFKANRIHIHKKCVNLISELETYSYPDKKDQRNQDELPVKEHDHLLDALRYAIVTNESVSHSNAVVHYPSNTMPRNNLPQGNLPRSPVDLNRKEPKTAYTFVPHL